MICPHCGKHIDEDREKEYSSKTPMRQDKYYEFTLTIGVLREKAILFNDGVDEFWVPISQMRYPSGNISDLKVGDTVTIEIKDWIAKDKGLLEEKGPSEYKAPDTGSGPIGPIPDNNEDIPF